MENLDNSNISERNWLAALLLCIFFGVFGAHRFYVGKIGTAILMLITLGGFGIWTVVDLIIIICQDFKDKDGKVLKNQ
ncbi:MAG: TM2 domain-containing protein [Bacteroidales bacterium]|jgi:TM2 domain-containing membrane protein YozV|nr:TM2 domain-containing protein [Bacteroidales bacterium]MCR5826899.1 TM2 domain-containing protein [Bacteroidales bacterium]